MSDNALSFIIPALNEEAHIGGVLASVLESVGQHLQYEVIVVDNGSSDRTVPIAGAWGAICLHAPGQTISSLRNLGAATAGSDIFVFLDADVYLRKEWGGLVRPVIERLCRQQEIITGSIYGISEENSWIERIWFAPGLTRQDVNYINGGHLIIHRSMFTRTGGFDPKLETGEDCEFCVRAKRMGARIVNNPELKVVHAGYPRDLRSFFARERWHGRGDFQSLKTFISSKPALISLANLFVAVACTLGIMINSPSRFIYLFAYVLFLVSVSLAASIHRYRGRPDAGMFGTTFLYLFYFTARSVSMADVLVKNLAGKRLVSETCRITNRE